MLALSCLVSGVLDSFLLWSALDDEFGHVTLEFAISQSKEKDYRTTMADLRIQIAAVYLLKDSDGECITDN